MSTGLFLVVLLVGVALAALWEVAAWRWRPSFTISALSRRQPILRWAISLAICLFLLWWLLHSVSSAS